MTDQELKDKHKESSDHRKDVVLLQHISCFFCLNVSPLHDIWEWIDNEQTAVCPKCGIDACLPGIYGVRFLRRMKDYWFSPASGVEEMISKEQVAESFDIAHNADVVLSIDKEEEKSQQMKITYKTKDAFSLSEIQKCIYENAAKKGFWDEDRQNLYEKCALITSEVSEVVECLRAGMDPQDVILEDGKPEGIGPELADIIIRVLDLAGHLGLDMETLIMMKHKYNTTRPHLHGKKA